MSCEICGRGSCTREFHSPREQKMFDNPPDYEAMCDELEEEVEEIAQFAIDLILGGGPDPMPDRVKKMMEEQL